MVEPYGETGELQVFGAILRSGDLVCEVHTLDFRLFEQLFDGVDWTEGHPCFFKYGREIVHLSAFNLLFQNLIELFEVVDSFFVMDELGISRELIQSKDFTKLFELQISGDSDNHPLVI